MAGINVQLNDALKPWLQQIREKLTAPPIAPPAAPQAPLRRPRSEAFSSREPQGQKSLIEANLRYREIARRLAALAPARSPF
jgi:hypothetical protein